MTITATLSPTIASAEVVSIRAGARVEAHPHRPKVKAGVARAISVRTLPLGRVEYVSHLVLRDAQFVVQDGGHARAAREQVRNVHAWVRGTVNSLTVGDIPETGLAEAGWVRVMYNPFVSNQFHCLHFDPNTEETVLGPAVFSARMVSMRGAECWALDPVCATYLTPAS